MPKKSYTSKRTSLFEIRLKNHDHDVLLLKGSPQDAASALLTGKIALAVNEPFSIKKLSLRLYATLRLNWTATIHASKQYDRNFNHEKKIYEYQWDNMEISKYLNNMYENSSGNNGSDLGASVGTSIGLSRNSSSTSIKSLSNIRSKSSSALSRISPNASSSNLSALSLTGSKPHNYTLVQGNYEFPFSAILPGDIPESVEGLPGASVIYKLEATIDRGKFQHPMVAKKHLRVVRTLATDSIELSESVAVDNTWPNKVEYSLTVPSKAIAIGAGLPITLLLIPLLKGLKLGQTKITLYEHYSYIGYVPPVHNGERVIVEKIIPAPDDDDPEFQFDKWQINTTLRIPPSLSKCTQDCDISSNIKVRHKIKFAIGLVNPDGHTSELRASLPVSLFVSPFVTVRAIADIDHHNLNESSNSHDQHPQHNQQQEEEIFTTDFSQNHISSTNLLSNPSNSSSYTSFSGIVAPPMYDQHIYDKLWSDVSPIESPITSGNSTPRAIMIPGNPSLAPAGVRNFNMSPIDTVQLNENLRLLSLQRQSQEGNSPSRFLESSLSSPQSERAIYISEADANSNDYFNKRQSPSNANATNFSLISPGVISPAEHLSRTHSESILNTEEMSRVPSYNEAVKSELTDDTPAPLYHPPFSGSSRDSAGSNQTPDDSFRYKSSSEDSSLTNLLGLNIHGSSSPAANSVAKLSSSASDRSAAVGPLPVRSSSSLSLYNSHFLQKKKERK